MTEGPWRLEGVPDNVANEVTRWSDSRNSMLDLTPTRHAGAWDFTSDAARSPGTIERG